MLFLDFILLLMISKCVTYSFILNKRIFDLQNSRIEFARMIKELNSSIVKAEQNVYDMSELGNITSKEIKNLVTQASNIKKELTDKMSKTNSIIKRLENQICKADNNDTLSQEKYNHSFENKIGEKFTENDLRDIKDETDQESYAKQFKNFIQQAVRKKPQNNSNNGLNQMGYYNTLRKINTKNR